jgi:1,6-anhydro-N-acetylmuramate kinase
VLTDEEIIESIRLKSQKMAQWFLCGGGREILEHSEKCTVVLTTSS